MKPACLGAGPSRSWVGDSMDMAKKGHMMRRLWTLALAITLPASFPAATRGRTGDPAADQVYRERFEKQFPPLAAPADARSYLAIERYEGLFMRQWLCSEPEGISNERGELAWSLAQYMISLNEMYEATRDPKYLRANLGCARAVLEARDDVRGDTLWTGDVAPVWGSSKYSADGRSAHLVHTAQIAIPILKMLWLIRESKLEDVISAAESDSIAALLRESLDFDGWRWRNGPGEGEGYYKEDSPTAPGPQPANCLASMSEALWWSWKLTGNAGHHERALALARFIKNRLVLGPEGEYLWPHDLPLRFSPEKGYPRGIPYEDIGHGGLLVSLAVLLATQGEVFEAADLERFGETVLKGFSRLGEGVLLGRIDGTARSAPNSVRNSALWLRLCPFSPEVYDRISAFYLTYVKHPVPLDLALMIRYAPESPGGDSQDR